MYIYIHFNCIDQLEIIFFLFSMQLPLLHHAYHPNFHLSNTHIHTIPLMSRFLNHYRHACHLASLIKKQTLMAFFDNLTIGAIPIVTLSILGQRKMKIEGRKNASRMDWGESGISLLFQCILVITVLILGLLKESGQEEL